MSWRRIPLRRIYQRVEESGHPELPLLSVYRDHGVVLREGREDNFNKPSDDLSCYKVVRVGDLVLNKMKTWQGSLGVSRYDGIVSPAYFTARCIADVDNRFMHHLLRSRPLVAEYGARSKGIRPSQWDLPWDEFASIPVNVPPIVQQRAIADYLDSETVRIDVLIAKKRRMSELLTERLNVFYRHRLAAMQPWLPLKRRWRVVDCKHRTPDYVLQGYPIVSPGDVSPGRLDLSCANRFVGDVDLADLADPLRRPRRGDIIYSRNASIGIAAYVDTDEPFCMGQDVCRITSQGESQLYLMYVLNSVGVDQLEMHKIGSTFSRVNVAQIVELMVPAPERATQEALAAEFESRAGTQAATLSALRRQIGLLQEHRQALITAAVTGELDIPGAAA